MMDVTWDLEYMAEHNKEETQLFDWALLLLFQDNI